MTRNMNDNIFILNNLDQARAFKEGDPRLATRFNNYMPMGSPRITKQTGLARGQLGGDIVYYLDPTIDVPFNPIVYGTSLSVHLDSAPYTSFRGLVIPRAQIKQDKSIKNSDMRAESAARNDLMAVQQSAENRRRPQFF